jgi:zinc transport system permease protein
MIDAIQLVFMQNALMAGIMISIACGIVGTLVVVNKMSYIAGGVAHAAYGGLGIAVFFGLPPTAGTLPFSIVSSLIMGYAAGRNREHADAAIGIMWAFGMAAGIILIELTPGYHADLMSYLFGSIMAVSYSDLALMAVLNLLIVIIVAFFYKELLSFSYDEEFSVINGIPVLFLRYLLLTMIACTVVMLIQTVGLILVIALFTIPASIAQLFSNNLKKMMVLSVLSGMCITVAGLFLSYFLDLTAGATIILVACAVYGILYAIKKHYPMRLKDL